MEENPEGFSPITENYFDNNDSYKYLMEANGTEAVGSKNVTAPPPGRDEELAKVEIAVLAMIFLVTVLGNFIVLMGIYFRRKKMSRMYYFILHLSIADLITAFFNVLTQLIWELTVNFYGGNFLCKFIKYAQILGPYSSSYVLVMTAVDRYQAICFPLSNCTWTARRSKIMLGFAWTLSCLLCTPQIFIFSYMKNSQGIDDCWGTFVGDWGAKAYVTWYAITVFIIPLIILTLAYGCICRAIWINFSMKNSIRRHQFSRASRISRESETEHDLSHTIVDPNELRGGNGKRSLSTRLSRGGGGDEKLYVPELKVGGGRGGSFWRREGGGGSARNCNRTESMRSNLTGSSFTQNTNQGLDINSGGKGPQIPDVGFALEAPPSSLTTTVLNIQNRNESDDSDEFEETAMDSITCPSFTCSSPTSPNIRISPNSLPNGSKLGPSPLVKSDDESQNTSPLVSHLPAPDSQTNRSTSLLQGKLNKGKKFVWRSKKKNGSNGYGTDNEEDSRELKGDVNLKQLLLVPAKGVAGNYSNRRDASFKKSNNTFNSSVSFRHTPKSGHGKGISRAKIKTIKLTVTVICCYVFCSSPFIAAQLWATYDPDAMKSPFWTGATFTILTLLASLNSCVNPWIFLFFNPNLLHDFLKGFGCGHLLPGKGIDSHSPNSATQRASMAGGVINSSVSSYRREGLSRVDTHSVRSSSANSHGVNASLRITPRHSSSISNNSSFHG